ncbi:MAG: hypothetical protein WC650_04425 [Candidatus Doudnabacteria bacterium]
MFNQILKIEISATVVAWYGAILATISFILTFVLGLLSYLRDKPRIKIKKSEGWLSYDGHLSDDQIIIEAINKGRRTVTLSSAGFSIKGGGNFVILKPGSITFPYELGEGKSVCVYTNKSKFLKDLRQKNREISYIWYKDATGKTYKTRCKIKPSQAKSQKVN